MPAWPRNAVFVATLTVVLGVVSGADVAAQQTELMSRSTDGDPAEGQSGEPAVSADGRWVAFSSAAENLVEGDDNGVEDVFVHDRLTGITVLVSRRGNNGDQGTLPSRNPSISADGRFVVFESDATELVPNTDENETTDVFLHDRDLDGNGVFDDFLPDETVATALLSTGAGVGPAADGPSMNPVISADGLAIVFETRASNYLPDTVLDASTDIVMLDRDPDSDGDVGNDIDVRVLISVNTAGEPGDHFEQAPSLSANGHIVAFHSPSTTLDPNDTNGSFYDVFVRDRDPDGNGQANEGNATTTLVSRNAAGEAGDRGGQFPSVSDDGRWVAFESNSTNLGDAAPPPGMSQRVQIWAHDLTTGDTVLLSRGADGEAADDHSQRVSLSETGRFAAFESRADNLVPGGLASRDAYLVDRDADENGVFDDLDGLAIQRLSVNEEGEPGVDDSLAPVVTGQGAQAAFTTAAANLVPEEADGFVQVVLRGAPVFMPLPTGFIPDDEGGISGFNGIPIISGEGTLLAGDPMSLLLDEARPGSLALLLVGFERIDLPFAGGILVPAPTIQCFEQTLSDKSASIEGIWPEGVPSGFEIYYQWWIVDPVAVEGWAATPGMVSRSP